MFQIFAYVNRRFTASSVFINIQSGKQMQVFFFIYVFFSVLFLKI